MRPGTSSATRVAVLHVRNRLTHATHTSEPLSIHYGSSDAKQPLSQGIPIGRDACHLDPLVSTAHGTLECTPQHGVWVYVDHSETGTTLVNQKRLVHRDAVVVRNGDVLALGNTEITLTFSIQRRDASENGSNNNQVSVAATTTHKHPPPPPPPPPAPILPSQLARQMLPNIQTVGSTVRHPQQPTPEYINSPIPGSNWRKKRHSISHITRKPLAMVHAEPETALLSASQTFTRPKPLALVPSAPTTPPQKDASPAARHVNHHRHPSPQSGSYYHTSSHVQFKEEPETIPLSFETDTSPVNDTVAVQHQPEVVTTVGESNHLTSTEVSSPPLEYSSSPVTSMIGSSFLNRLQHSPSSSHSNSGAHASKPSPPTTPAPAVPFVHKTHQYEPPTRNSHRPIDLRIQVAKRNAGLVAAASRPFSGGTTTTPTAATATRPTPLSRGITIPTTQHPSPPSSSIHKRRLDFTPPASPVAHQDILRQNQSLLNILKTKYKEEQKLKREQEEWMRSQFPSTSATTPSLSPIRHEKEGGLDGHNDEEIDVGLLLPPKAPALLRTVSLGQTQPAVGHQHQYHQPSPRLTQAVLASRARKGSFDGSHHQHHHRRPHQQHATLSPRGDALLRTARDRSSSSSSSVASSVSTEPSNHRRVVHSLSFSPRASGELSEFLGYDDDDGDDRLLSFTSYYEDGPLDTTSRSPARTPTLQRSRLPSLDDDMAGVLNSPSHSASSGSSVGRHSAFAFPSESSPLKEPKSVAKPRSRSAEMRRAAATGETPSRRKTQRSRHPPPLGVDLSRA